MYICLYVLLSYSFCVSLLKLFGFWKAIPMAMKFKTPFDAINTCLPHLSSTLVSHSGCLARHEFTLVPDTCPPHLSPRLVSHSQSLGPHEFTLVFHLSPTLVSHSGCLGPNEFTLVSHTCLPLWVPWAA